MVLVELSFKVHRRFEDWALQPPVFRLERFHIIWIFRGVAAILE